MAAGADDLLVFGAGRLGGVVARRWLEARPRAEVVGVTRSSAQHPELRALGVRPVAVEDLPSALDRAGGFPNVIFSAPPRLHALEAASYTDAVRQALSYWSPLPDDDGADGGGDGRRLQGGGFVLTSSGGVFAEDGGGSVDEGSAVSDSPRASALLAAEELVRHAGGIVLRLAGLYDFDRGPHAYWLSTGEVRGSPDGIINLVHYEDAADAVHAALAHGAALRGETFLVGDGTPLTRREIVVAAMDSGGDEGGASGGRRWPRFLEETISESKETLGSGRGRVYDSLRARQSLKWSPRYPSFVEYMSARRRAQQGHAPNA